MEQRCKNILQNYLTTKVYNNDYEIINNFIIIYKYKNIKIFNVFNKTNYIKYNICNKTQKGYNHNYSFYYFNNKNNKILFSIKSIIKIICNNKEEKYYNKFCKMYKKIINIYKIAYFKYYYSIKPYIIYLKYPILYNYKPKPKIQLYSNNYSIIFLLCII